MTATRGTVLRRALRPALALLAGTVAAALGMQPVAADTPHPTVVSDNPANYTPSLVRVDGQPRPIVEAIAVSGNTVAAGGRFTRIAHGGNTYDRANLVLFDRDDGDVRAPINVDGRVWAAASIGDWIYVGGKFSSVGGVGKRAIARINAQTGEVDPGFTSAVRGRVNVLVAASNGVLYAGGSFGRKVMALDPVTGRNTGAFDLQIADEIPNAWGNVSVYGMAVNPQATRLVATGNFRTVAGQSRTRLFVADLTGDRATLHPWYYPRFASRCSSTHPRRIAYLQGVDFDPTGSYFAVAATGQIPASKSDIGHTVCDGIGRFDLADDTRPQWINYTGGDSVWSVSVTGAAVYAQGHFEWLDNPNGWGSRDGGGAVRRLGIGAIDPVTGLALDWAPRKPARIGGRALVATPDGLWVGSDSTRFGGEPRAGIAFAPLP